MICINLCFLHPVSYSFLRFCIMRSPKTRLPLLLPLFLVFIIFCGLLAFNRVTSPHFHVPATRQHSRILTWGTGDFYVVSNHPEISGITFTPSLKKKKKNPALTCNRRASLISAWQTVEESKRELCLNEYARFKTLLDGSASPHHFIYLSVFRRIYRS